MTNVYQFRQELSGHQPAANKSEVSHRMAELTDFHAIFHWFHYIKHLLNIYQCQMVANAKHHISKPHTKHH